MNAPRTPEPDEILPGLPRPVSRHGRVMALSMMKDEGPFVIEWVAHHLAVGFTDFVIYTNDCSDGTDDMLRRMQALGLVQHRDNRIPPGMKPQPSALKHAQAEPEVAASDWLMVFDADEFLCLRHGDGRLDTLIDAIEAQEANGMVVTWRIFGSGGVRDWSRAPVTEQYLHAAPPMWNKGWGVKTLFRFDPETWKLGIHRPKFKNKVLDTDFPHQVKWLNGSGRPMEEYFKFRGWRSIVRTVGYDWAQMNHYAIKSMDSYALRRFRGNVNNKSDKYNADYWALQDRNEVRDDGMLRYSEARGRIMAALLSDPELARLHRAAVEGAEARLAEYKATPAYAEMIAELEAASQIPITRINAAPPKKRDRAKIAAQMSEVERRTAARRAEELAKAPEARILAAADLFVGGVVDVSQEVPLDWYDNHGIALPADPRLLTPQGLIAVEAGKFQRNLARNIGGIVPQAGRLVEWGGFGFLSLRLLQIDPSARALLVPQDAGWRGACDRVLARAGATGERLAIAEDVPATLSAEDVLCIAVPGLARAIAALGQRGAGGIILTGAALVELPLGGGPVTEALEAAGYTERLALDSTVSIAMQRPRTA